MFRDPGHLLGNEFVNRDGGAPDSLETDDLSAGERRRRIDWLHLGAYQHIGYPSVVRTLEGSEGRS